MTRKTQQTELFYQSAPGTMVKVPGCTGLTGLGGAADRIDKTDLDSTQKEYLAGLPDPGPVNAPLNYDPGNAVHQALDALFAAGTEVWWVVGMSDGTDPPTSSGGNIAYPSTRSFKAFRGYVSDLPTDFAVNSKIEGPMVIQRSGDFTRSYKSQT